MKKWILWLYAAKMKNNNTSNKVDAEQFVSLLTSNQRRLFAYIMSLVVNVNDADDIMQETVKTMWERFDRFEVGTDFLAWATTIAYYRVLTFRKRKSRGELVFNDEIFYTLHDQSDAQLRDVDEYLAYLRLCLKKLKSSDRGLIKLRYVNGLPVKQIALRLGQNLKSVYRSIARIQNLLRYCVKRQLSSGESK